MTDLQKCILTIFKKVDEICAEHEIPYYAIGGTCLGAVREKGFIPWDDDLDIAVKIEDFDRLRSILTEELPDYYRIHDCKTTERFHYVFMKVEDTRTALIEDEIKKFPEAYTGVFVDIMPLSGVPANKAGRALFTAGLGIYKILNSVRRFPFRSQNSRKGRLASTLLKLPVSAFRFDYFSDRFMGMLRRRPSFESEYIGYVWAPKYLMKWTFPSKWFSDEIRIPFEDTDICCPINYHEYLTKQFGDYMTPPPPERRMSPHKGIVDLEHSFTEYQKRP